MPLKGTTAAWAGSNHLRCSRWNVDIGRKKRGKRGGVWGGGGLGAAVTSITANWTENTTSDSCMAVISHSSTISNQYTCRLVSRPSTAKVDPSGTRKSFTFRLKSNCAFISPTSNQRDLYDRLKGAGLTLYAALTVNLGHQFVTHLCFGTWGTHKDGLCHCTYRALERCRL